MKKTITLLILISLVGHRELVSQSNSSSTATAPVTELWSALKWRNIGPHRGGRANTIAGVIHDPMTYYAGYTGGGIWKTSDAGLNWQNISDTYFTVGSIGDMAVSTSDPNVIYAGTGEHAVRGVMTSFGNGVYKSTNAGETWDHMGLEKTRHISDVIIHPDHSEVVFVAAQGALHGSSTNRGVYKSTDGGKSWRKTLYIDENSGISSLVMDITNPRILYAASWQHRRYPWKIESGGPGSGIYKSEDSGETWQKLTHGLPESMGKIGLSVSPVNPKRVFALIESEKSKSGMYRSDDGGMKWNLMSNDQMITARSWYYMEVFADPNHEDVVYALNAPLMKSIDGGKTFQSMRLIHGDCHDLWINPNNSSNIALAEDGGATISFNRGKSWSSLNNQATAQLYRITADQQSPFWVYGGQQDNLSVAIPSRTNKYGILSSDWFNGPGCESATVAFNDPANPEILYGGCYNGQISLLNTRTMESKDIMPYPMTNLGYEPKDMKYRFNWNAPLINSPHDPSTMYFGGNVVFKTNDGGINWEVISPDLSYDEESKQGKGGGPYTNEGAGGENYNTIYYIAESPLEKGVIYTGSDCGKVFLTKDDGSHWKDITPDDLADAMIHSIEVSPHHKGTVYLAGTRYKFNDFNNYSFKSTDYGKNWIRIGDDIQADDFFRVIREDKKVKGILYAGAERGFYISYNGGESFEQFQLNLPVVPVTDMVIRDNSLAAATAGRSFWILDDLAPIQQTKGEFGHSALHLFQPKDQPRMLVTSNFFLITEHAFGENPQEGINFFYYLKDDTEDDLILEIENENGEIIRTIKGSKEEIPLKMQGGRGNIPAKNTETLAIKKGLNSFTWDFRTNGLLKVPETFIYQADYRGHRVSPGIYTARLKQGDKASKTQVTIWDPPEIDVPKLLWEEQQNLIENIEHNINDIHGHINYVMKLSNQISSLSKSLESIPDNSSIIDKSTQLKKLLDNWLLKVIELRQKGFQDALNWPAGLNSEFFMIRNNLDTYDPTIPAGYQSRFNDLEEEWQDHKREFERIKSDEIQRFNNEYKSLDLPILNVNKDKP